MLAVERQLYHEQTPSGNERIADTGHGQKACMAAKAGLSAETKDSCGHCWRY